MFAYIRKWALPGGVGLVLLAALVYAFWPQPVPVDMGTATRGPMMVTVDEEGETRVKDVYVISAPVSGRLTRFEGDVGDDVAKGETILTLYPSDPSFLDRRTRSERQAAVEAAEAARDLAAAEVRRAEANLDYAEAEYKRAVKLAEKGTISESALDRARMEVRGQRAALETARANLKVEESRLRQAKAALMEPAEDDAGNSQDAACCLSVRAPVSGTILRIHQESEAVVTAGMPLVEIGDPRNLEIVTDLLSRDAVGVTPGTPVLIEDWGGPGKLHGRVRRVEPFGFTKVSTLGIEEQRVNVITDFTDPQEQWRQLGHGYRVDTRIVLWQADDVLQVPLGALFREDGDWALFRVADGRAALTSVEVGHMNTRTAEIRSGIEADTRFILHPSDRVSDGTRVTAREIE